MFDHTLGGSGKLAEVSGAVHQPRPYGQRGIRCADEEAAGEAERKQAGKGKSIGALAYRMTEQGVMTTDKDFGFITEERCIVFEKIRKHPSFGMIGLSHVQSTGTVLVGSEFKHKNFIKLTIQRAENHRDLSRE